MDRSWKNKIWPSKRSNKIGPILQFFQIFFKNGTLKQASFFIIELSGSIDFIQAFKHLMNMNGFEKKIMKN